MLNFAEFEKLTIAGRVKDAYDTKARETGLYQGGKVYFGYIPERRTVNGEKGSVLVPSPVAPTVAAMYDVYKQPTATLYDVVRHIQDNDLSIGEHRCGNMMDRSHISRILASPLYVRFGYIQGRINELHTKKSELEDRLMMIERRVKKVDTAPLIDPLKRWDTLTNSEKHEVAILMIDRITMSDETGIDIQFAF